MKKEIYLYVILMLSFSLLSTTCSSDDDNNNGNSQEIAQIVSTVESGTWRIISYIDSGQDETNDFIGYDFTFANNGTLTADNGTDTINGTWSVTDDSNSSNSSNSESDIDFNIQFPVPESSDFEDLNDDWDIVSYNNTTISLIDISGGNGGTDTLVFQKN